MIGEEREGTREKREHIIESRKSCVKMSSQRFESFDWSEVIYITVKEFYSFSNSQILFLLLLLNKFQCIGMESQNATSFRLTMYMLRGREFLRTVTNEQNIQNNKFIERFLTMFAPLLLALSFATSWDAMWRHNSTYEKKLWSWFCYESNSTSKSY